MSRSNKPIDPTGHDVALDAFMNELAKAWPAYRSLGYAIAQRCSKDGGDVVSTLMDFDA
jgi:hypothetical protein